MLNVRQAQKQVQVKIRKLEELRRDLLGLETGLSSSAAELSEEDVDPNQDPAPVDEIKVVIRCVVHDYLDPLIHDLRAIAAYRSRPG